MGKIIHMPRIRRNSLVELKINGNTDSHREWSGWFVMYLSSALYEGYDSFAYLLIAIIRATYESNWNIVIACVGTDIAVPEVDSVSKRHFRRQSAIPSTLNSRYFWIAFNRLHSSSFSRNCRNADSISKLALEKLGHQFKFVWKSLDFQELWQLSKNIQNNIAFYSSSHKYVC